MKTETLYTALDIAWVAVDKLRRDELPDGSPCDNCNGRPCYGTYEEGNPDKCDSGSRGSKWAGLEIEIANFLSEVWNQLKLGGSYGLQ